MSDNRNKNNLRSRVTVTLGPTGRVVKRAGEARYSNGVLMAGRKHPVIDRSGDDLDDRIQKYYKRQRGDVIGTSSSNDMHLDKHDLRFKLLKKNKGRQSNDDDSHGNFDLRDKLLKKASQSSVRNKTIHQPESAASTRQHVPEPTNSHVARYHGLEPRDASILGSFPSSRSASESSLLGPVRTYSLWGLDNLQQRSPERLLQSSAPGGMSSDKSREELLRRQLVRAHDDVRSSSGLRISPSRPISSSLLTRSSLPNAPLKSVVPLPLFYPQSSGILPKVPSVGRDHPTVESLLESLGLGKYAILFKAEEIDMNTLRHLSESDLKGMGIPMGPRKKIFQAIVSRPRQLP